VDAERAAAIWYRARSASDAGRALQTIRKQRRRTQIELADDSGISRSTIQRIEQGADVALSTVISAVSELGYEVVLIPRGSGVEIVPR
jgi:transcriptional regulator with XRE-family HTH domain